jgi:excinuclease UvrABC ATPase subunit
MYLFLHGEQLADSQITGYSQCLVAYSQNKSRMVSLFVSKDFSPELEQRHFTLNLAWGPCGQCAGFVEFVELVRF